jgi:MerR family transcriptional regulator, light-induced transcriptional regulator
VSSELLSTKEAAVLLNVGGSTVKRWADEGRLACVKTAGGHRRFHRHDLARLAAAHNDREFDVARVLEDAEGYSTLARLYELRAQYGSWCSVAERVGIFLNQVGDEWRAGSISIAEEHAISERLVRAISAACRGTAAASSPPAPLCVLVMAQGDDHAIGLRLAELVAKESGWCSLFVGSRTPLAELANLLTRPSVRMLAASASTHSEADELSRQARTLAEVAATAQIPLVLGGLGPWPEKRPRNGHRIREFETFRDLLTKL